jgi:hypothetical protein
MANEYKISKKLLEEGHKYKVNPYFEDISIDTDLTNASPAYKWEKVFQIARTKFGHNGFEVVISCTNDYDGFPAVDKISFFIEND